MALVDHGAGVKHRAYWLLSDAAPAALITGLFVISTVTAAIGYLVSSVVWRWWIGRKRRRRMLRAAHRA